MLLVLNDVIGSSVCCGNTESQTLLSEAMSRVLNYWTGPGLPFVQDRLNQLSFTDYNWTLFVLHKPACSGNLLRFDWFQTSCLLEDMRLRGLVFYPDSWFLSLLRTPWIFLQTRWRFSLSTRTRRSGTWSVTRYIHSSIIPYIIHQHIHLSIHPSIIDLYVYPCLPPRPPSTATSSRYSGRTPRCFQTSRDILHVATTTTLNNSKNINLLALLIL